MQRNVCVTETRDGPRRHLGSDERSLFFFAAATAFHSDHNLFSHPKEGGLPSLISPDSLLDFPDDQTRKRKAGHPNLASHSESRSLITLYSSQLGRRVRESRQSFASPFARGAKIADLLCRTTSCLCVHFTQQPIL